jgi:two-component system KDP operon response regulator KdpE
VSAEAAPAPRVLVVEDDVAIRRLLRIALQTGGFDVSESERGRTGVEAAATGAPDVVVLDLGLPDMDGKEVVAEIRAWSRVPILVLTVRGDEAEKIAALDAGADDYVTKPFATGELLARLRALVRNRRPDGGEATRLAIGGLVLDLARHQATLDGADVKLTRKEFEVLAILMRAGGRLIGHKQLLRTVWGPAHDSDVQYLRIVVGRLRDKLGDDAASPRFILTEPGVGYRMAGERGG